MRFAGRGAATRILSDDHGMTAHCDSAVIPLAASLIAYTQVSSAVRASKVARMREMLNAAYDQRADELRASYCVVSELVSDRLDEQAQWLGQLNMRVVLPDRLELKSSAKRPTQCAARFTTRYLRKTFSSPSLAASLEPRSALMARPVRPPICLTVLTTRQAATTRCGRCRQGA